MSADAFTAPIAFEPLFMERVWGGRRLAEVYGKALPPDAVIGESWELSDREEAESVVRSGPLKGRTLHELWRDHRADVLGARARAWETWERFPILVKLLDATQTLSVQVHPPSELADELGGEPKNEMWILAESEPGAHIYAGLDPGVTREAFEAALKAGDDVAEMLHRIDVDQGDAIFIPSGRVHAIGAGCLIVEVQQNSDTTYRVFDFNRPGLDGEPRELHVPQSMRSIDWHDVQPRLLAPDGEALAHTPFFEVDRWTVEAERPAAPDGEGAILCVLTGEIACAGERFGPGEFLLAPAAAALTVAPADGAATALRIMLPAG